MTSLSRQNELRPVSVHTLTGFRNALADGGE